MLGKLIKYDLKWHNRVFIPLYLISILFAIITRILIEIGDNSALFHVIGLVFAGITYSLLANVLINTITRVVAKFVSNIYKDESYLTHTLPVERKIVFLAKILVSIIYMITSVLIILLSLFIILYTKENFEVLKQGLEITASMYDSSVVFVLITLSLTIMIEFILIEMIGFLGIILGHRANDKKIIKSLAYGLVIYFATQICTLLIVLILGIFNPNIMEAINSNNMSIDTLKQLLWICNAVYAGYAIIYYQIAKHQLCKGVNVD